MSALVVLRLVLPNSQKTIPSILSVAKVPVIQKTAIQLLSVLSVPQVPMFRRLKAENSLLSVLSVTNIGVFQISRLHSFLKTPS